jgi:histidinol-phosphate phosphatase family protein
MATTITRPTQAVIFAGGRGTRLGSLTVNLPKPLVLVAGKPFLDYIVEMLRRQGFQRILLLLGYLAEAVMEHYGDGTRWGVQMQYCVTDPDVQTLTRIRAAQQLLDDVVLTAYCDNYVPLNFDNMWRHYVAGGAVSQVTAYANDDGFTRSNLEVDAAGKVLSYDPHRMAPGLNRVDIGFAIIDLDRLGPLPNGDVPFEHAVYPRLVADHSLNAYVMHHRYYGVGSMARLPAAERFFTQRRTVILDRDGVLNRRMPKAHYVSRPTEFVWLDGALDALRLLTQSGFRIVVATNQAGIARGKLSQDELAAVHRRLLDDATAAGARIDRIYHCPHGWDEDCHCRKPSPGVLFVAQRDIDLDLSRTVFVGDDDRDQAAAEAAGCQYLSIDQGHSLLDAALELTGTRQ